MEENQKEAEMLVMTIKGELVILAMGIVRNV